MLKEPQSWVLMVCAMLALLGRVGQGLYLVGTSRSKNAAGAAMRMAADFCVATLAFVFIGGGILLQANNGWFGFDASLPPRGQATMSSVLFFAVAVLFGTGVVWGAVGERCRFFPVCAASALLAGLVVPAAGRWAHQFGWLWRMGYTDLAGAAWVHVSAGVTAGVAAYLVGPRQGKYHRDGSSSMIPGHSVPLAGVGVLLMLAGWLPYAVGCQFTFSQGLWTDRAALNALVSAAAGGAAAMIYCQVRYGKPDVMLTLLGLMGGLVASAAAAGAGSAFPGAAGLSPRWAVAIGATAGVLTAWAAVWIDLVGRLDDPTGAVAVHAVAGAWGVLAVPLVMPGTILQRLQHLGVQALGLVVIAAMAGGLALALFLILKRTVGLRSKEADEFDGLDLAEHDIGAYPDFQQNTIRSYHLREA